MTEREISQISPRPWPLAVLAALAILAPLLDVLPAWPGLTHAVALPPLGLVHDLAALLVYSPGWPSFALGALVSVLVRAVLLGAMVGGLARRHFVRALRFYLLGLPLAFLAAALLYASGAVIFYALFWFGVLAALVLVVLFSPLPWMRSESLRVAFRQAARRGLRAGTTGAYLLLLALVGAVADAGGAVVAVVMVPVSATLTWFAARWLWADPGAKLVRRALSGLAGAGLAALALVAYLGPGGPPLAPPPEDSREGSIMLMSGVDSASGSGAILEIDPHVMGWTCERTFYFSYAGPGTGQPQRLAKCPITHGAPYTPEDTLRSTEQLVRFLEAQTANMVPPGVLATHSQGVWISWAAAVQGRIPNVEALVLVGPFPRNPIAYPPADVGVAGAVGRDLVGIITEIPRPGGTTVFQPDSPLGREWLAHPDAISETLERPLPGGLRAVSVPSVFDLPLMGGERVEAAAQACPIPVIHPNLPYSLEFQEVVVDFFERRPLPPCPFWRTTIGPLFRHFTAPPTRFDSSQFPYR